VLHKSGGAGDGAQDTFGSEIGVGIESQLRSSNSRSYYAPMQPSVWTSGVNSIHIDPRYGIYRASNDAIVLFGSVFALESRLGTRYQCEPLVITYSMGRGRVIVVSDDLFGSNANMARPGTAEFIERILSQSARPGAKILFDEYHRGAAPASKTLWAAIGMPAQYAAVQLLIAALIAALVLIPRLGRSEPLADRQARTSAEYIASLAGLYRNAGASGAALEAIYRQFLREICQRFALPPDISLDRLAQTASHRGGVNLNNLRRCLIACERAIESPTRPSDRDLVALVRAIEQFRKEMWIG
jgi:hypothetical protein